MSSTRHRCLAMCGNTWFVVTTGEALAGTSWVEVRDASQHPRRPVIQLCPRGPCSGVLCHSEVQVWALGSEPSSPPDCLSPAESHVSTRHLRELIYNWDTSACSRTQGTEEDSDTRRREASVLRARKRSKALVTFLQYLKHLSDTNCEMVVISLNLNG